VLPQSSGCEKSNLEVSIHQAYLAMAVIPTIFDMPDRLQARAMASNNLSSGAIAGIVLGCIFGLALALVVLSICRCGGTFFFIAKRWSRSVTDKAEKVHARANDLYTAGRDRRL
jgi:hypothetical protein